MATEAHMATWEKDANDRTTAAMAVLTERFGIDVAEQPFERLDARMLQIRLLQRHADVLDALVLATGGTPADDLSAMTRAELNDLAEQRGIENASDKKAFPNKDALITAITEQEQTMTDPKNEQAIDGGDDQAQAPDDDAAQNASVNPEPANEPPNEPPAPSPNADADAPNDGGDADGDEG